MRRDRLASAVLASGFSRVMQYLHGFKVPKPGPENLGLAFLTSQNPNAQPVSPEENKIRYQKLIQYLDGKGMTYWKTKGRFVGVPELSVIIQGITQEHAEQIGRQFNQAAVVWSGQIEGKRVDRLVFEDKNEISQELENVAPWISQAEKPDADYTELKGRKFKIPFYEKAEDTYPIPKTGPYPNKVVDIRSRRKPKERGV